MAQRVTQNAAHNASLTPMLDEVEQIFPTPAESIPSLPFLDYQVSG